MLAMSQLSLDGSTIQYDLHRNCNLSTVHNMNCKTQKKLHNRCFRKNHNIDKVNIYLSNLFINFEEMVYLWDTSIFLHVIITDFLSLKYLMTLISDKPKKSVYLRKSRLLSAETNYYLKVHNAHFHLQSQSHRFYKSNETGPMLFFTSRDFLFCIGLM